MPEKKEPVVSVTAADCEWNYARASGPGGQGVNKSRTKVRCRHVKSGAVGFSQDTRDQSKNRRLAFKRMADTPAFRRWLTNEHTRRLGTHVAIEDAVAAQLTPSQVKVESRVDKRWAPWPILLGGIENAELNVSGSFVVGGPAVIDNTRDYLKNRPKGMDDN